VPGVPMFSESNQILTFSSYQNFVLPTFPLMDEKLFFSMIAAFKEIRI
jgi:hypothetical protein